MATPPYPIFISVIEFSLYIETKRPSPTVNSNLGTVVGGAVGGVVIGSVLTVIVMVIIVLIVFYKRGTKLTKLYYNIIIIL